MTVLVVGLSDDVNACRGWLPPGVRAVDETPGRFDVGERAEVALLVVLLGMDTGYSTAVRGWVERYARFPECPCVYVVLDGALVPPWFCYPHARHVRLDEITGLVAAVEVDREA
jgi:hypothetical protein